MSRRFNKPATTVDLRRFWQEALQEVNLLCDLRRVDIDAERPNQHVVRVADEKRGGADELPSLAEIVVDRKVLRDVTC